MDNPLMLTMILSHWFSFMFDICLTVIHRFLESRHQKREYLCKVTLETLSFMILDFFWRGKNMFLSFDTYHMGMNSGFSLNQNINYCLIAFLFKFFPFCMESIPSFWMFMLHRNDWYGGREDGAVSWIF